MTRDLERKRCSCVEDLNVRREHLDSSRSKRRVLVALGPLRDVTGDPQDIFRAQLVRNVLIPHHNLGDAAAVPHVNEDNASVVAAPVNPAFKGDAFANRVLI